MSKKEKLTTDPDVMEEEKKNNAQDDMPSSEDADQAEASLAEENGGREDSMKEKLLQENEALREEIERLRSKASGSAGSVSRKPKKKKKVRIRIPKDYKHKDDLTVGLNGTLYRFQRGKTVEVDEDVAEIIERSMEQDLKTDEMISDLVSEAEKGSKQ